MKNVLRRKWRLILIILILVAWVIGLAIGPIAVQVFGSIVALFAIIAILISGNGGSGGVSPQHYQSGNTGGMGGFGGG